MLIRLLKAIKWGITYLPFSESGNQYRRLMRIYRMVDLMLMEETSEMQISLVMNLNESLGFNADNVVVYMQIRSLFTGEHIGETFVTYSADDYAEMTEDDIRLDVMPSVINQYAQFLADSLGW